MPWRDWLGALKPFPLDIALVVTAALAAKWAALHFGFSHVYLLAALIVGTAFLMGTGRLRLGRRSARRQNR